MIKYGAAKTREEKQRANFQRQIRLLKAEMEIDSSAVVGEKAGLGVGRIYRLWHEPWRMTSCEMDRLARLFERFGLVFDPTLGGAAHAG